MTTKTITTKTYRNGCRLVAYGCSPMARVWYVMDSRGLRLTCDHSTPQEALLAAARERRFLRLRRGLRCSDGGLWGVREFDLLDSGGRLVLVSPIRRTVWTRPALVAEEFEPSPAVDCAAGIHAYWPAAPFASRRIAQCADGRGLPVIALVRGYGRTVQGANGWRAERVVIDSLITWCDELALELSKSYPDVYVYHMNSRQRICVRNDPLERRILRDAMT